MHQEDDSELLVLCLDLSPAVLLRTWTTRLFMVAAPHSALTCRQAGARACGAPIVQVTNAMLSTSHLIFI